MKNKIFFLLYGLCLALLFQSCINEDDEPNNGPAPEPNQLQSNVSGSEFVLSQDNSGDPFAILSWTAVTFKSVKPIKYTVEMDLAGQDFAHAIAISTTGELADTVTVQEMNQALIYLGVDPGESASVEIRVRSWIDFLTDPGLSNSLTYTLTPYLLTFPPIYIIGDAQAWTLGNAASLESHSPGVYTGEAMFQTNGKFRFFGIPDWGAEQWGWSYFNGGAVPDEFGNGNDGDSNFLFGGQSGSYIVTVSIPDKTISIEPAGELPPPPPPSEIFVVTSQTVDLLLASKLQSTEEGGTVYSGVLMLESNSKFRLFASQEWSSVKWNWNSFKDGSVDSNLMESGDDVSSILFTGATGWYIMTVATDEKTITLEATTEPKYTLFVVGDGYVGGWDLGLALSMKSLGNNQFEGIGTFQAGNFRFFAEADWGADQYGYSSFSGGSVDANLSDAGDGDSNFTFVGTPGVYKITVDLAAKTVVMESVPTPTLYLIGDDQSWTPASAVSLTWMEGGVYEGTATFTNGSIFRFFANNDPGDWDWNGEQWRYSSFADGTIDANLADGGGSDSNFSFVGTTGTYTIHVDLYNLVVQME